MKNISLTICLLLAVHYTSASVQPNSLFSDHLVLQKGVPVPIWGTADNGTRITVKFNRQTVSTIAQHGKWMVKLSPMNYLFTPSSMVITGGRDTVTIHDILVGEVWLCSGQSNMERQLGPRPPQPLIDHWEQERDAANYPLIREFYVPEKYASKTINDVHGNWTVCSPKTVTNFSAVGYLFARDLYQHLKVPVGILFSAYGGTPAEDWTSKAALEGNPELKHLAEHYDSVMDAHWHPEGEVMNGLYNGMIYPLIPFAMKGVAWYQGENNSWRPRQYAAVLNNMIKDWRHDFHQGNFPFLIVQITPNKDMVPELRESQFKVSQKVKNTALIVTTDCGDANQIHSPHKQPVGERLALAARALAYKEKIEYSGPTFHSFKIKRNKIILYFTHTGKELSTKGTGALKGFTIAGNNNRFVPATAMIKGRQVIVYSNQIQNSVAARYGWANVPDVNLYNSEGLPASPFRTDSN